ncbi:MAG: ribosomal RNA small subunit methyltransferase A [Sedimentisphaerales bacterium]|nr:ribosomal RNA small subunit methyltransferase A [Sedimentisphaerales bacterium]
MQTKSQIRELLEASGIKPNKRFGQNFLIDLNLMKLLADSADIQKNDIILEAGCGTGSFTSILAEKAEKIIAVEIDSNLYKIAKEQLSQFNNVELLNVDILESKNTINERVTDLLTLAQKSSNGRILLVANLPYNVATPVMMNFITGKIKADGMYVTIQKEVADRMKALPGTSDYGGLSIIMQACGDVELLRVLKPSVFWPKPQVDSAFVKFVRNKEKIDKIPDLELFTKIVHIFLNHRRKTLHACSRLEEAKAIGADYWTDIFTSCSIDSKLRPDQITSEQYIDITTGIIKNK